MGIITTKDGRKVLKKAASLTVVPYVWDSTAKDWVLGGVAYDLSAIIGDSITLEQSEGDKDKKKNEFTPVPVIENITSGDWGFTAQCLDLQNNVLKALFGALTATETQGGMDYDFAAFLEDYTTIYALVKISFRDTDTPDVYLPKVLLNSQLTLSQMKTRGSQGNLAGTAFVQMCGVMSKDIATLHLIQFTDMNNQGVYAMRTPILFVPQGYTPVFLHDIAQNGTHTFSRLDLSVVSGSCVSHDIAVANISTGIYTIVTP